MVTAPPGVQTDLSKVVNSSCRPICHSSEPQGHTVCISSFKPTWKMDTLKINWLALIVYFYPPTALLNRVSQNLRQHNGLLIIIAPGWPGIPWFGVPSAALNGDPTPTTGVNNTSQAVPQPSVPQQPTTSDV